MASRFWLVFVALVPVAGCASEPEPDIVGICQPAIELQLPPWGHRVSGVSFEYVDFQDGGQQMTGAVDAADGTYVFECGTNARMQRTNLRVWQASVR
jgi:hypothetical protein